MGPMSKAEQERKGRELLGEAVPFLLQADLGEDDIGDIVHDLVGDWEEGQIDAGPVDDGIVRRLKPGRD